MDPASFLAQGGNQCQEMAAGGRQPACSCPTPHHLSFAPVAYSPSSLQLNVFPGRRGMLLQECCARVGLQEMKAVMARKEWRVFANLAALEKELFLKIKFEWEILILAKQSNL